MSRPDANPIKLIRKRLDADGVAEHLRATAAAARAVELRVKGGPVSYSEASSEPVEEVGRRLVAGEIVAVQIRWLLDDGWWADTLMSDAKGYRLVRMREELPPDEPG